MKKSVRLGLFGLAVGVMLPLSAPDAEAGYRSHRGNNCGWIRTSHRPVWICDRPVVRRFVRPTPRYVTPARPSVQQIVVVTVGGTAVAGPAVARALHTAVPPAAPWTFVCPIPGGKVRYAYLGRNWDITPVPGYKICARGDTLGQCPI